MIGALTDSDLPVFCTFSFIPRLKAAGCHAEHGDPVAVVGVHVGLDLEDEARDLVRPPAGPR